MRRAWLIFLAVASCAEVPDSLCFAGEPCADAGAGGGAATGGGASSGGGTATGGGAATGGGTGTGGGGAWTPVSDVSSSLGLSTTWAEVGASLPPLEPSAPSYAEAQLTLAPPFTRPNGFCDDPFRGAVSLRDGVVLAVPRCANRFARIDVQALTAEWVGPVLPPGLPLLPGEGYFGGAVLGCDGSVYALPLTQLDRVMRVSWNELDGGLDFTSLPIRGASALSVSGGVVARPCSQSGHIIAAGVGGLWALQPFVEGVEVAFLPAPQLGGRPAGVARVGDDFVLAAPWVSAGTSVVVALHLPTLTLTQHVGAGSALRYRGLATRLDGGALAVSDDGAVTTLLPDAGAGAPRSSLATSGAAWPASTLTGWVVTAGSPVVAWSEGGGASDAVVASRTSADGGSVTSTGLLLASDGVLVATPPAGSSTFSLYVPTGGGAATPAQLTLSPWFNKL